MIAQLRNDLAQLVAASGDGPLFVHADLMQARSLVGAHRDRESLLREHWATLEAVADGRAVWTPCFHYDFTRTGQVDLRTAPCQVGPLGDYARHRSDTWRTTDPVFSVCGTGNYPHRVSLEPSHVAFGPQSVFAELYRTDATVLFYGAPFSSATIVHYAEQRCGGPVYRYDKVFRGTVVDSDGASHSLKYVYHVRPLGRHLDYDWSRLGESLQQRGVLRLLQVGSRVVARAASCRALVDAWVGQLHEDPLSLLDSRSRQWVAPALDRLGRRFQLADFEPTASSQVA